MRVILFSAVFILAVVFDSEQSFSINRTQRERNRTRNFCPTISIKNGRSRIRGQFIQYSCIRGFTIVGEKYAKCQRGYWDSAPPKCVKGTCLNTPKNPGNGYSHKTHKNAVYVFYCEPGYDLLGDSTIYCDGSKWDGKLPSCIESGKEPQLFCDFEKPDLCGWNHDVNHDFDWLRHQRQTPSFHLGTGPSHDVTKGANGTGYYMYTEATSRNLNDVARLISPIYKKSIDWDEYCFSFHYHMYGHQTGELRVYMREVNSIDNWNLTLNQPAFLRKGNQENAWHFAKLRLGVILNDFQIIFEAKRGPGYQSDIAIDNVRLIPNCTVDEETTTTEEYETEASDFPYESCANRCGQKYENTTPKSLDECRCDEDCVYSSSCCPDFYVECMSDTDYSTESTYAYSSTDDYTYTSTTDDDEYTYTTDDYTFTDEESTYTSTQQRIFNNNTKPWTFDVLVTVPTTKITKQATTIRPTTSSTTTTMRPKTTKPTSTTTIRLKTKTTTVPKTKATRKVSPVKTTTRKPAKKPTPKKKLTPKPNKRKPITAYRPNFEGDDRTVPSVYWRTRPPVQKENEQDGPVYQGKADSSKTDESKTKSSTPVIIGLLAGCVIVVLFVAFLVQRYVRRMGKGFMGKSYRARRNQSSMSDVRFLAEEEQLDFTMRTEL